MAKVLGGRQTVPLEEVVLAQAFQLEALLNVLEQKGVIKKAEVLGETNQPREKSVKARWKHHERRGVPTLVVFLAPSTATDRGGTGRGGVRTGWSGRRAHSNPPGGSNGCWQLCFAQVWVRAPGTKIHAATRPSNRSVGHRCHGLPGIMPMAKFPVRRCRAFSDYSPHRRTL
jgi:hypothetical protein